MCKKIHRGGNAEQYHADKKYKEAVAVAVEAYTTLRMRCSSAEALCTDPGATLDDLHEAVTTLEETERTARRVLGGAHPLTEAIGVYLKNARATVI